MKTAGSPLPRAGGGNALTVVAGTNPERAGSCAPLPVASAGNRCASASVTPSLNSPAFRRRGLF